MKKISEIISFVFNPFFIAITVFGILLLLNQGISGFSWLYAGVLFVFVILVPFLLLLFLKTHHEIETLEINHRERRIKPLLYCIISYVIAFVLLLILKAPYVITAFTFCYISNTLIVLFITFFWKVSVHAIGLAGPLAALTFALGPVIYPFYGLLIIVGASRVVLKRHTVLQVITGSLLGLISTAVQLKYLEMVIITS